MRNISEKNLSPTSPMKSGSVVSFQFTVEFVYTDVEGERYVSESDVLHIVLIKIATSRRQEMALPVSK